MSYPVNMHNLDVYLKKTKTTQKHMQFLNETLIDVNTTVNASMFMQHNYFNAQPQKYE